MVEAAVGKVEEAAVVQAVVAVDFLAAVVAVVMGSHAVAVNSNIVQ